MKNYRFSILFFVVAALFFGGCQNRPSDVVVATPTGVSIQSQNDRYWAFVQQAQQAYAQADYEGSMQLARQAIDLGLDDDTAWELYTQASIADAGNTYLQDIPDHRYTLPVDVFVRDRVNRSRDWFIIDVREPEEYTAGHIQGAVNIPYRDILLHLNELPGNKAAPILLYCHSQKRATHDLVILHELGYSKVFNLEGGYAAYEEWMTQNILPTPGPTPTPGPDEPDFGC
jgi:rhodanese-related sulfurtransferase